VAGVIGLLVLAAVGGGIGWRVWRRRQRAPAL
jgi:predicted negative regulator of RcsB-dependent stress response